MKSIGIVFPGQGSQKVGMGKELYETFPEVRAIFDQANEVLGRDIAKICFEGPDEELLKTVNAQPAIFLVSASLLSLLEKEGVSYNYVAGHSLGELTAYYAAGVFDLETALTVIQERGQSMADSFPQEKSGMVAVMGMEVDALESVLSAYQSTPVVIANYNCPGQLIVSGEKQGLDNAVAELKSKGAKVIPLKVSGAFHSPLMQKASDRLNVFLDSIEFKNASVPIILNRTGLPESDGASLKQNLVKQVVSSVQWIDSMTYMSKQVEGIVECGQGKVLTGLNKKILSDYLLFSVFSVEMLESFKEAYFQSIES